MNKLPLLPTSPIRQGVWANGDNVEQCRNELVTVLEEWLLLKVRDGDSVPDVAGLKVEIREVAVA